MNATNIAVEAVSWDSAQVELRAIRTEVFVHEQQVAQAQEWDGLDEHALHVLARAGVEAVGTGRLLLEAGNIARIGRMAVRKAWRGQGIGAALLRKLIALARERGCEEAYLHAQTHALAFYARHGFVAEGDEFWEADIPHISMRSRLRC